MTRTDSAVRVELDELDVDEIGTDPTTIPKIAGIYLTPAAWLTRKLPAPDNIMGGIYSTTSRTLLAADTGLGKSMFGLSLGLAMQQKRDFLRWKAKRAARVLVVDGEMPRDLLQERIRATCDWFSVKPPADGLFILSTEDVEDMQPLDSDEGARWLLDLVRLLKADFVVIDNVSCLTSGDLREETTWRALVPLSRELSRQKVGQLWLHHVGHDKSKPYGSRVFSWAMDAVIMGEAIADDLADVSVKLTCQKSRRRTPENRGDFEPVHVRLADGRWSAVPVEAERFHLGPQKLTAIGAMAVSALTKAIAAAGQQPPNHEMTVGVRQAVRADTWRTYFGQCTSYDDNRTGKNAERMAFKRGMENALGTGKAKIWGEWAWLT